jgi:sortase A
VQPITFKPGDPIAVLRIPAIGVEQTVVSGVGRSDLQKGPGHFRTTPLPGQAGNAAIAGHRTTYGEPFRRLDELKPGDRIEITDVFERRYVYRVEDRIIVRPDDVAVLDDRGKPELTLVTCDPPFTADRRLVVRALLDESSSATPTPATTLAPPSDRASELDPPGATVPPEVTSTTAAGATSSTPATTAPAQSVSPLTADEVQGQLDGFQQTWFSDAKAWPHVAAWGAALTLVALAAWRVSRRVRRNWVGALVGIAPFVVVLYFFFQNVNRLLPAGF